MYIYWMVLSNLLAMPNYMKLFKCIWGRYLHTAAPQSLTQNQLMNFSQYRTFFFLSSYIASF